MSTVDFYILKTASHAQTLLFACDLIEKAYQDQQSVYVHTDSAELATQIDGLLWTYKENSFIPHQIVDDKNTATSSIQIGYGESTVNTGGVLVNLSQKHLSFYADYAKVIEIVFSDPAVQQLGRERYRYYRDQGCTINTHK